MQSFANGKASRYPRHFLLACFSCDMQHSRSAACAAVHVHMRRQRHGGCVGTVAWQCGVHTRPRGLTGTLRMELPTPPRHSHAYRALPAFEHAAEHEQFWLHTAARGSATGPLVVP